MLPIRAIEAEIRQTLARTNRLVLTAPTGSGKTTQVPQMLLDHPAIRGRIAVLQPRRLATRMMATRVAAELGSPLGETVGFQTRHERVMGSASRIVFMTEGVLLRQLQQDPRLNGVGAVVLDEFHERSLTADLLLGLLSRLQRAGRDDLRLIVMSATLASAAVSSYLGCPTLETHGRSFPVDVRHVPARSAEPIWARAAKAVREVLDREPDGDLLVFMPGVFEIRRTIEACQRVLGHDEPVVVRALHGALPIADQDAALAPRAGRKIIVATNIAETSITIDGVRHVVDSGLARLHSFDPRRGLNVLHTGPISQASATQRAGRAGRTAPGTCLRLWPKGEHVGRPKHDTPEVRRLDLAEAVLQLHTLGVGDVRSFPWLDPPEEQAVTQAEGQLRILGAIDASGGLTQAGRRMARFPMHPRLARMLLESGGRGCTRRALLWAAMAGERDIVAGEVPAAWRSSPEGEPASDLAMRERLFEEAERARFAPNVCRGLGVDATACREVGRAVASLRRVAEREGFDLRPDGETADLIKCLLAGFPDHVALCSDLQTRRCQLPGQKRVLLDRRSVVARPGPLLALEVQEQARAGEANTLLSLCSEVDPAWLAEVHPTLMMRRTVVQWSEDRQRVEEVEEEVFGELPLDRTFRPARPAAAADVLVDRITRRQLQLSRWDEAVEQWIARTRCVAGWRPDRELVLYDAGDLEVILHEIVAGAVTAGEVRDRPVLDAIRGALSWEDQRWVEQMAPAEVPLPSGRRMKLTYQPGQAPRGRAKIQDLYGLDETPRVAGGRQPVLLEILGPNFRPVQVTDDLANFWQTLYPTLRNELRRRYPRHEWR